MEKKYRVDIRTPNKIIFYNRRAVRSPVVLEVTERELKIIQMKIRSDGIEKYSINEIKDEPMLDIPSSIGPEILVEKETKKEETEADTILNKLLNDE